MLDATDTVRSDLIKLFETIAPVAAFADPRRAIKALRVDCSDTADAPAVIVTDRIGTVPHGSSFVEAVRAAVPRAKILLHSRSASKSDASKLHNNGLIHNYVAKGEPDALLSAVRQLYGEFESRPAIGMLRDCIRSTSKPDLVIPTGVGEEFTLAKTYQHILMGTPEGEMLYQKWSDIVLRWAAGDHKGSEPGFVSLLESCKHANTYRFAARSLISSNCEGEQLGSTSRELAVEHVLQRATASEAPSVFVLGSFGKQISFNDQQCRAINLLWSLFETEQLSQSSSVAVVGGGLAGMTFAAAAAMKGCKVVLLERGDQLMPLQRGSNTRFIHPNINHWPEELPVSATCLPCLNWTAGSVKHVIQQIQSGWTHYCNSVCIKFGQNVERVDFWNKRPTITANGAVFYQQAFDAVILAAGFGEERTLEPLPTRSYWHDDSLHQELSVSEDRRVLVSGCGDGGLVDVQRLRIRNYDHGEFVLGFVNQNAIAEIRDDLLAIDLRASRIHADDEKSRCLYSSYEALDLRARTAENVASCVRSDTHVMLNGNAPNPMSLGSAVVNRIIVFSLLQFPALEYRRGRLKTLHRCEESGLFTAELECGGTIGLLDDVIVRHGAKPAIDNLLPSNAVYRLLAINSSGADLTSRKLWPTNFL